MSLDKNSIDKEIERLSVEALMFWELPKVRDALNDMCKKCFFNDCNAYTKGTIDISEDTQDAATPTPTAELSLEPSSVIVGSQKEKERYIELGFVEKLIE